MKLVSYHRYLFTLGALFGALWLVLGINPDDRVVWIMENSLVVGLALLLAVTYRAFPLSRVSYTLIFLFLCLHEIGAHYTYSKVPYDEWFRSMFNVSLNQAFGFERNQFDRLVHFSYGLLMAYPVREVFLRIAAVRGFWGYFLPFDVTVSTSALFELIEWGAVVMFSAGAGADYLGTQGDEWDAHKDMALASLGALIAMTVTAVINASLQRDFAREWAESLKVKRRKPLGENALSAIRRLLD